MPAPRRRAVDAAALVTTRGPRAPAGNQRFRLAVAALGGFALLYALVSANRSAAADLAITLRLQRRRAPWLSRLMALVSWPGFSPQSRIIPAFLVAAFWAFGRRTEAIFQLLAWGTALLSMAAKAGMRRPRPAAPLVRVVAARLGGTSFPSGHVLTYVGVYGFLATCLDTLPLPSSARRALIATLCALLALVGPSRIYQGHHWPTDVLASYLLGTSYVIGLTTLYDRVVRWQAARR
jgi:undecaprenyl-diphosphatase